MYDTENRKNSKKTNDPLKIQNDDHHVIFASSLPIHEVYNKTKKESDHTTEEKTHSNDKLIHFRLKRLKTFTEWIQFNQISRSQMMG